MIEDVVEFLEKSTRQSSKAVRIIENNLKKLGNFLEVKRAKLISWQRVQ
jgi:hypothetical protein